MTDEANRYSKLGNEFANHGAVDHSRKEYGYYDRETGANINTNTVEGYYSIFKRGMIGVYQHCGEQHLHRYLAEFDFRYSHRIKTGYDDTARAERALLGVKGKRLTYETTAKPLKVQIAGTGSSNGRTHSLRATAHRLNVAEPSNSSCRR